MTNVLFSVIIPTYNRAGKLKQCIESLQNQTVKDFEVIVCDDGSTDETAEVVTSFIKEGFYIQHLYAENWGGPARPRNRGIKESKGEWICFLDSDDRWYPKKLEKILNNINDSDLIYHDLDSESTTYKGRCMKARQLKKPIFTDLMINGNTLFTSSVCIRKDILMQIGGFSEEKDLIAVEDFDLWLRLAKMEIRFNHIAEVLGCYWRGGGNITTNDLKQIKRIHLLYEKHLPFLNTANQKKALRMKAYLLGKVYQQMGLFKVAMRQYIVAFFSANNAIKIRSLYFLFHSLIRRR